MQNAAGNTAVLHGKSAASPAALQKGKVINMERKSIGQFIAALRKANGMTQKQFAEKLNVSDKAVSRWERDECAPDLSLIPVIAEIFQVTSDEIIRGERISPEKTQPEDNAPRKSKQIERMLNSAQTKLSIRSMIAVGIAAAGLLAAMICNFAFLRAYVGFFLGLVFFLASGISEAIIIKLAFSSIDSEELEDEKLNPYKRRFVDLACRVYFAIAVLFAASLPLVIVPFDAYEGVTASGWLKYGLICVMIAAAFCFIALLLIKKAMIRTGVYTLSEAETEKYTKTNKLTKNCLIVLGTLLLVTFLGQAVFNQLVSPSTFAAGTEFTDLESFKEYMETPVNSSYADSDFSTIYHDEIATIYYDENGNEISEEEALTDYLYDRTGKNVLVQFIKRNESVCMWSLDWDDNDNPIITTYTDEQLSVGSSTLDFLNCQWAALYLIEIAVVGIVYGLKRKKLR